MKRSILFIMLVAGLLTGMMSCTSKAVSNKQADSTATDSINLTLIETVPVQTNNSTNSVIKDTFSYEKKGPFVENDTTFLYRFATNNDGYYCFEDAYIERDRQSKRYQQVLNYASTYLLNHWDVEHFDYELKYLKEKHPQSFPKHTLSDDFPRNWIPIRSFQNTYYISELSACYTSFFTDSLYIKKDMDGPIPYIIQSFKQVSPTHYLFDLIRHDNLSHLDLQIIDTERKIAVITTVDQENERKWQTLYIAKDTAPLLDAICWNSTDMPEEFHVDFDKIDFETLLKQ